MTTRRAAEIVLALYFALQMFGLRSTGLTDDDDFYIPAGISYAGWLTEAATLSDGAFSKKRIDAAFEPNHEHPPVAKYVFGLCHRVFSSVLGPVDGARMGTVFFSTLIAALLMWLSITYLGDRRGLCVGTLSLILLSTLPRFYFHAHAATLDVPVSAMYLAAATCVLHAERSRRFALWAGPVFGLACATKLNAPFLLLAYLPFVWIVRAGRRKSGVGVALPLIPAALISMAIIGPLTFLLVWPWMWFDTIARLTTYVNFHLNHYGIFFLYFGRIYSGPPFAPWHAPFVMTLLTVPVATLLLALSGTVRGAFSVARRLRTRHDADDAKRKEGDLLLFCGLNVAVCIAVVAFSGAPIYGGTKLFLPMFPFLCLIAAYGAHAIYEHVPLRRGWAFAWVILVCASAAPAQLRFGGYGLSYYNALAGGLRGATALGMERQYYDVAFRDLVNWFGEHAPQGAKVHFVPNNWEYVRTYKWYREARLLRADIRVVNTEHAADWVVVTHERRFARYAQDLRRYRGAEVVYEKIVDSTPLWTVVANKPR